MYLLDSKKLQRGDIILTNSDSEVSKIVRRITKSNYSHAILYVGEKSCLDSDGYGVQAQNIQRMLFQSPANVVVLRLKEDLESKLMSDIIHSARLKVGTEYSLEEAKISYLKKVEEAKMPNRQFCSRFVAQSFQENGISLVSNADYCVPEDILKSPLLIQVEDALKKASQKEIEFAQEKQNSLTKQTDIINDMFKKARTATGADIQNLQQLTQYVIDHPEHDLELTEILKGSGYLEMWKGDLIKNPWHYDISEVSKRYSDSEDIRRFGHDLAMDEPGIRERLQQNVIALRDAASKVERTYIHEMLNLYQKLVELSLQRESVGKLAADWQ